MCNPVTTKAPESLLAKGEHEGFEWEVTNNGIGYRCGYVRIPARHPWHGKDYDDVEPYPDIHGGLTFAEPDSACGKGGTDNAWWLGFDCAHAGDAADPSLPGRDGKPLTYRMPSFGDDTIKTTDYVEAQCRSLIEQAKAVAPAATTKHLTGFDPAALVCEFAKRPGVVGTVTMPTLTAGALIRRDVRAALNQARVLGAEVEAHEERGVLDSTFSLKMRGTGEQLMPTLRALAELAEEES